LSGIQQINQPLSHLTVQIPSSS